MIFDNFQSFTISIHAPTRGATTAYTFSNFSYINFNPRSHEGSDNALIVAQNIISQFQSTLPRGERRDTFLNIDMMVIISIHAPTRGATKDYVPKATPDAISIHAPTRGATAIFAKKFSFLSAKIV